MAEMICEEEAAGHGLGGWGWTAKLHPFTKMLPGSQPALQKHKEVTATQQTTNELLRGEQSWGEGRRKQAGQVL